MQEKEFVGVVNDGPAGQAAHWFARLRSPQCESAERQDFENWLAEHPDNRAAYERVARTAAAVSDALKRDVRLRALLDAPSAPKPLPRTAQANWRRLSLAAAWVAAVALTAFLAVPRFMATPAPDSLVSYVNSELRGQTVTLADGTTLHLDAASEMAVAMSPEQRRLTLVSGRAFFDVAHDSARPFIVEAAGTRTTAHGTRFEVRLQPQGVVVTLVEGSVSVRPADEVTSWKEMLEPGQQFAFDATTRRGEKHNVDASHVTSWTSGRLYFDGVPLTQVLADINRYSSIKVVLGDERLAGIPIGGNFVAGGDAGAFVQALSTVLPLRSEPSGDHQIVLFPREQSATAN